MIGRVTDLNPVKGYVELETIPAGVSRVVVVTEATNLTKPGTITVAELQVGDHVSVSGIPMQLRAGSINVQPAQEPPDGGPGGDARTTASDGGDSEEPEGDAGERGDDRRPAEEKRPSRPEGTVSLSGEVTALDPVTVSLSSGLTVSLDLTEETVITKPMSATIEDIKTGDFLFASGQRNADDLLEAAQARIVPADEAMARMSRFPSALGGQGGPRRGLGGLGGDTGRGGGPGGFGDRGGGGGFGGRGTGDRRRGGGGFGGGFGDRPFGEGGGGPGRDRERAPEG